MRNEVMYKLLFQIFNCLSKNKLSPSLMVVVVFCVTQSLNLILLTDLTDFFIFGPLMNK